MYTCKHISGRHTPAGPYDRTKAQASLLVKEAACCSLDKRIICSTGVIGPYDYRRSEMGELILSWMTTHMHFIIDGAFDFVDVRDVAKGQILVRDHGRPGETYILGGERIELKLLHSLVEKVTGKKKPMITCPLSIAKIVAPIAELYCKITKTQPVFTRYSIEIILRNSDISSEKAKKELGYHPRSMLESITDTVRWWGDHLGMVKRSLRIKEN